MPAVEKKLEDKGLLAESKGAEIVDLEKYNMGFALIKKSEVECFYLVPYCTLEAYRKVPYKVSPVPRIAPAYTSPIA